MERSWHHLYPITILIRLGITVVLVDKWSDLDISGANGFPFLKFLLVTYAPENLFSLLSFVSM